MSKAFTKEDGGAPPEVRRPIRIEPGETRYITREGYRRLVDELEALKAATVLPGSEGGARAQLLESILAAVTVVGTAGHTDRVIFGSWVDLEDEDGTRVTYRLVGPDETDARQGLISIDSPVARAILGKEVGE